MQVKELKIKKKVATISFEIDNNNPYHEKDIKALYILMGGYNELLNNNKYKAGLLEVYQKYEKKIKELVCDFSYIVDQYKK